MGLNFKLGRPGSVMAQKQVPLNNAQRSSMDELAGGSAIAMNVVTDSLGAISRRPGVSVSDKLYTGKINATRIDEIYATYTGDTYAIGPSGIAKFLYKISPGGFVTLSNDIATGVLGTARPVFAETEAILVITAGDEPQKVVLPAGVSSRLGGTPPKATHCVANHSRLVMNDPFVDKSKLRYSDVDTGISYAGHEVWSFAGVGTSGYFSAEARPDPVVAIKDTADSIFVFGATNLQVFVSDSNLVYAPASTLETGCSAPYSIVRLNDSFAWLNHRKQIVVSSGVDSEVISNDIANDLAAITSVSGCFGYRVNIGQYDLLVWTFPDDKKTFSYQVGGGWSQWSGYDSASTQWSEFPVSCVAFDSTTSKHLVGTITGYVGEFNRMSYTDLGAPIKAYVESGFVNRGTDNRKQCRAVHVKTRKSRSSIYRPIFTLSYSDSPGVWSTPITVDAGYNTGTETITAIRSLGIYRHRNWRLEFSEQSDMVLSSITEDYEVLGV